MTVYFITNHTYAANRLLSFTLFILCVLLYLINQPTRR